MKVELFKNKAFLNIWLAQLVTQLAFGILIVGIAILADSGRIIANLRGMSLSTSMVIFVAAIPGGVLGPLAGIFSDWFDKKEIMLYSNFIRYTLIIALLFFWTFGLTPYVLLFFLSIAGQFFAPAEGSSLPLIVEKKHLLLANTLFAVTQYSSVIFGFVFSGLLIDILGANGLFLFCSFMFMLGIFLVRVLPSNRVNYDANPSISFSLNSFVLAFKTTKAAFVDTINYIKKNRYIFHVLTHLFIINSLMWTLSSVLFRIFREIVQVENVKIGYLMVAPGIIGLVIGLVGMNKYLKNWKRKKLIFLGVKLFATSITLFAIYGILRAVFNLNGLFLYTIIIPLLIIGISGVFLVIPAQTMLNEDVDQKFLGRVYGLWLALVISFASVPPVLLSMLADRFTNISYFLVIIAVFLILYAFYVKKLFTRED